jgi:assimilatory nitrate reductase catalytic subunit
MRETVHLPLLRRGLRRRSSNPRRRRSPACAATPTTPPTSAGCAPRAPRCTSRPRHGHAQTRLLQPMQRLVRGAAPTAMPWDTALDTAAAKFAQVIRDHGPDAVGFYVSGQLLTEDYYVFNKLAKGLVGTNNIDTNSRLCMSSAVAGYKKTLGADAPPACYDDLDHAQCLFIVGSNTAWAHPILFRRIEDAKAANPAMKIVVADPRRTDTVRDRRPVPAAAARHRRDAVQRHAAPDAGEGWTDADYIAAHTSGFDALEATVRDCTPDKVAQVCGIEGRPVRGGAPVRHLGRHAEPVLPGAEPVVQRHGEERGAHQPAPGDRADRPARRRALLAHRPAQRHGRARSRRPGQPAERAPRPGQPRAPRRSGRAVGRAGSCPRSRARPPSRCSRPRPTARSARCGLPAPTPPSRCPTRPPCAARWSAAEFVVVQEAFATTATCAYADLLLPATTWGEKVGTVTNSERRISRVRPAVPAPGEARNDWSIAVDFARRLEALLPLRSAAPRSFPTRYTEAGAESSGTSTAKHARARPRHHRPELGDARRRRPPAMAAAGRRKTGRARLYEDGVFPTPDGRARFVDTWPYQPVAEAREPRYPFSLNTGRLRDQWHGMSRTGTLGRLFGHVPEPVVQMHPQDMARRQIREGDLVHVTSKRGSIVLPAQGAQPTSGTEPGLRRDALGRGVPERPLVDRRAAGGHQRADHAGLLPDVEAARAQARAGEDREGRAAVVAARHGLAARRRRSAAQTAARADGRVRRSPACVPFGSGGALAGGARPERSGLLFRAAAHEAPTPELLAEDRGGFARPGRPEDPALHRPPPRPAPRRPAGALGRRRGSTARGLPAGRRHRAEAWIKPRCCSEELPAQATAACCCRRATAPVAVQSRGKVGLHLLQRDRRGDPGGTAALHGTAQERLATLQGALKCGTNCGSCLPELKRMVRATPAAAAAPRTPS